MLALIIIFCIALAFALLLSTKIILRIKYDDKLIAYIRILFIKIPLYPKEERKKRYPHSMSRRKAKKIKDSLTKKKKEKKPSKKSKDEKEKSEKKDKNDILSMISIITAFVKNFLKKFLNSARIKVAKLHVTVATDEAAKTAVMYGAVSQSVNVLFPMLEGIKNFKKLPKEKDLLVEPDFLSDKSRIDADITLYVRVGGALKAIIYACAKAFKKAVSDQIKKLENKR